MDDFYDDFDDDFSDDDGDSFSDDPDDGFEMDDSLDDDTGIEDKSTDDLCDDEFTSKEAVIFGMAMNFAYEEGLEEAERRKLEKKMDDDMEKKDEEYGDF